MRMPPDLRGGNYPSGQDDEPHPLVDYVCPSCRTVDHAEWFQPNPVCDCGTTMVQDVRADEYDRECPSCLGHGHFTEDGEPTTDGRCRKCLDCRGSGRV